MANRYICVLFLLYTYFDFSEGRCECEHPNKHYEELGCLPIYANDTDCCPVYFDCASIFQRLASNTSCYFNNKEYKEREGVDYTLTKPNCLAACFCSKHDWEDFTCAHIDCAEFFGASRLGPDCYRKYELDGCCSAGTQCPPFDDLAKCEVGNETYYEGQRFYPPSGECVRCLCQKGFNGKYEEPFCKPIQCAIGLKMSKSKQNCAPLYFKDSKCCPIEWTCQEEDEAKATPKQAEEEKDPKTHCRFGNSYIKIGEKFTVNRKYSSTVNCECHIPPLATCGLV